MIKQDDFVLKVSRKPVNKYGTICFEDLDINKMVKNNFMAKNIMDVLGGNRYTTLRTRLRAPVGLGYW